MALWDFNTQVGVVRRWDGGLFFFEQKQTNMDDFHLS